MSRRRTAFTLIELMVTIAILGLLIAILLPSLSAARRSAKAKLCLANLKTLGIAVVIYIDENGERLPPVRLITGTPDGDEAEEPYVNYHRRRAPRWQWFLDVGEEPVIDPRAFQRWIGTEGWFDDDSGVPDSPRARTMTSPHFACPMLADDYEKDIRDGAYGYNYQYLGNTRTDTSPDRWDDFPVSTYRIRTASETVVIADSRGAGRKHGPHSFMLDPPRLAVERHATRFGPSSEDLPPGLAEMYEFSPAEARHGNRANVVFLDAHAEALTLEQLGYQFKEDAPDPRDNGVAEPLLDPHSGNYVASNKMWTGEGKDAIAAEHHGNP